MINVLFICHGNICRSPMGEFVLKDLVEQAGLNHDFYIASAGTSSEELGNPVHPGTRKELAKHGISCEGKHAVQLDKTDYGRFDYFLTMEEWNVRNAVRIFGGDPKGKVYRLLDFTDRPKDIDDPWYTHEFDVTYRDILAGCKSFLQHLGIKVSMNER